MEQPSKNIARQIPRSRNVSDADFPAMTNEHPSTTASWHSKPPTQVLTQNLMFIDRKCFLFRRMMTSTVTSIPAPREETAKPIRALADISKKQKVAAGQTVIFFYLGVFVKLRCVFFF